MARKSGNVLRGGRFTRDTLWTAQVPTQDTIAGAATGLLISIGGTDVTANTPCTVVRTRGLILLGSDQRAATEDFEMIFGMSVVSDQAAAIGVTAVPTPVTDSNSDMFFVYEPVFGRISVTTDVGVVDPAGVSRYFDSKAMRKIEDGQNIAFSAETSATSDGIFVTTSFRMLLKLH